MTNRSLRTSAFIAGAVVTLVSAACDGGAKPVGDVLAQDSTLALDVMSANQDTAISADFGDTAAPVKKIVGARVTPSAPEVLTREVSPPPRVTPAPRRVSETRPRPARARAVSQRTRPSASPARRSVAVPSSIRTGNAEQTTGNGPRVLTGNGKLATVTSTPSRAWLVIPAGSELNLESSQQVCTSTAMAGDVFSTTITEPVMRASGTVIPQGTTARAEILSVGTGTDSRMAMRIESILIGGRTYPVSSRVTYVEMKKVRTRSSKSSASKVATGAAVGAVVGQVIGKNTKSTVIGAVTGAAGGAVLASRGGRTDQCIPDGGRITAELIQPLRIPLSD